MTHIDGRTDGSGDENTETVADERTTSETEDATDAASTLQFTDSVEFDAGAGVTKAAVWALCSDPEVLATCIPGAEDIERVSERQYEGVVTRGVHSLTVSLDGEVELVELNEPDWVMASGRAYDPRSHTDIEGLAAMEMSVPESSTVRIDYRADVTVTGGAASVPNRILRQVAGRDIGLYFDNLRAVIETRTFEG